MHSAMDNLPKSGQSHGDAINAEELGTYKDAHDKCRKARTILDRFSVRLDRGRGT